MLAVPELLKCISVLCVSDGHNAVPLEELVSFLFVLLPLCWGILNSSRSIEHQILVVSILFALLSSVFKQMGCSEGVVSNC